MNSNSFVISTEGLSKSFGEIHALKSLDLRVPPKSISWLPLISTVVSCVIFIAVAIWRFNRQEF